MFPIISYTPTFKGKLPKSTKEAIERDVKKEAKKSEDKPKDEQSFVDKIKIFLGKIFKIKKKLPIVGSPETPEPVLPPDTATKLDVVA